MKIPQKSQILRIFIGENDKYKGQQLYEWIVLKARKECLAGATVLHGIMGFGANTRIHTSKILRLSLDLPIVIEIIDGPKKIQKFLAGIEEVLEDCLVTIEDVNVYFYKTKDRDLLESD